MKWLTANTAQLSSALKEQAEISWDKFTAQHATIADTHTVEVLADFKKAITLSDFILSSALQAPVVVLDLFTSKRVLSTNTPDYPTMLNTLLTGCETEVELHRILRRFRLQEMVRIAVADLLYELPLDTSLNCLSELADTLILAALEWLTGFCQQQWGIPQHGILAGVTSTNNAQSNSRPQPLLVYGMGKLGGRELNFSSDIDLIFTFPHRGETFGARRSLDNQKFFTRLAQKLIAALHQQTADGFVYRVDMRLRPFGESGPLVLSFSAMEDYYQEQGRDWERYAMLKARLIGESDYHQQLADTLKPFVYRRYIDFSVIDSLRKMKMMIAREVRRKQVVNNIKLGAGGIREIEFIVQVFQLIRGGRIPKLQQRHLLTVLPLLVSEGEISQTSEAILENAYRFLRRVENIIQALADRQTQTLPDNDLDQQRIQHVLGFSSWQEFLMVLHAHTAAVHNEFGLIIGEESPNHQANDEYWQTLWLCEWPDEDCIHWINKRMPDWPGDLLWQTLKAFKENSTKRSIGHRGRLVLDKLVPLLLWHLQASNAAESTLARILHIFNKMLTRTAYLELLFENEGALKHLIRLCQASPWVAEHIAKYPILLDELIDPQLLHNPPLLNAYALEVREVMLRIPEEDLEAQMDMLRHFKQTQHLRIAAADIVGVLPLMKVSDHLTALAESCMEAVIHLAWQQMSERYGVPSSTVGTDNKGFAAVGYGKSGGIELSYSSDLDLVFIHNSGSEEVTTGNRQILASVFYMKMAQRIMHICNTRMGSGQLYEIDMRLRPSGNSGLLVVHIDAFEKYQQQEAWTWEHQALVRARVIYGNSQLTRKFNLLRANILTQERDPDKLKQEVLAMRNKMRSHLDKSADHHIDIKQGIGGLVDIEFLAQYLVLKNGSYHPEIALYSDNIRIFMSLAAAGVITENQGSILTQGYCQLRDQGHSAILQDKKLMLNEEAFEQYSKNIQAVWKLFL